MKKHFTEQIADFVACH
jgi:hypothetical protein